MKPWERFWYVVQVPNVAHFGEHAGQQTVYASDTSSKDSEGSMLAGYMGPALTPEDAALISAAPELYRALDSMTAALMAENTQAGRPVDAGYHVKLALEALKKARGER